MTKRKIRFRVVVTNVGTVYEGCEPRLASLIFDNYVEMSKAPFGRASAQDVALFDENDIVKEYLHPTRPYGQKTAVKTAL